MVVGNDVAIRPNDHAGAGVLIVEIKEHAAADGFHGYGNDRRLDFMHKVGYGRQGRERGGRRRIGCVRIGAVPRVYHCGRRRSVYRFHRFAGEGGEFARRIGGVAVGAA